MRKNNDEEIMKSYLVSLELADELKHYSGLAKAFKSFQAKPVIEVTIIKRPIDSLSVFEITDYELEQLEKGYKRSRLLSLCPVMFIISAGYCNETS